MTIAELDWRNGHEYAIQAMSYLRVAQIDFEYHIVGQGEFLEAVAFACYEFGLKEHVRLILDHSNQSVAAEFVWADVFVLASVASGVKHSLCEAIEQKIPVIVTDLPNLLIELHEDCRKVVVPRRNSQLLAEAIIQQAKYV